MGQMSVASLRMLAEKNIACRDHSKNLAGLKKFTEKDSVDIFERQQDLQNTLEKIENNSKSILE